MDVFGARALLLSAATDRDGEESASERNEEMRTRPWRFAMPILAITATLMMALPGESAVRTAGPSRYIRPWQAGDRVWTVQPPLVDLEFAALTTGCARVPASGYIGAQVYAQTASYYTNHWDWTESSSHQAFHWYVFTNGGTLKAHGASPTGSGGNVNVTANYHYWKVQNQGTSPQAWNVCFSG